MKWSKRRRSCAKTTKTYKTRKVTVGRTKKSVETNCFTWLLRKVRQVWEGGLRWRAIYFATVAWETSIPSLSSSPWIRGAPHSGFARLIFRISSRASETIGGRPGSRSLLFHLQYQRNPWRCQEITVSGLTIISAVRHCDQKRESQTQNSLSVELRRSRARCDLLRTANWWRRARISTCIAARDLNHDWMLTIAERRRGVNMGQEH